MSTYTRVLITVPESMIEDANHLAVVIGISEADFYTFKEPTFFRYEADGAVQPPEDPTEEDYEKEFKPPQNDPVDFEPFTRYTAISTLVYQSWIDDATTPGLTVPDFAEGVADLAKGQTAQAAIAPETLAKDSIGIWVGVEDPRSKARDLGLEFI